MLDRLKVLASRIRGVFSVHRLDGDFEQELDSHLAMLTDENIRCGMSPAEAHRAARLRLGSPAQLRESHHDLRTLPFLESLVADIRFALRMLRKNPGFAAVAVLTLALGIGANTAIFTLIDAVLLRQLPVQHPERLVELSLVHSNGDKLPLSFPMLQEIQRRQQVFTSVFGWYGNGIFNVQVGESISANDVWAVTGNFYSELGTSPLLGRVFIPSDVDPSGLVPAQVAVLGYGFWQRRFGGDPAAVGMQIFVEGQPFTIIGVTRKEFSGMDAVAGPDVTIPVTGISALTNGRLDLAETRLVWIAATGRLKDRVTVQQARAQLETFWPQVIAATVPQDYSGERRRQFLSSRLDVSSAATGEALALRTNFTEQMYVLMGMVALLLLGACLNLANLMLARAAVRSHEMSVRLAVGASRWRLTQQMAIESLLLSGTGGGLGLALAYWGSRTLVGFMTQYYLVPVTLNFKPDVRTFSLTSVVAILTGLLCAVAPTWLAVRQDPANVLQQSTRGVLGGTGKTGRTLIMVQVALSVILLFGAGLLVRSLERLRSIDPGFQRDGLLVIDLEGRPGGYKNLDPGSYHRDLVQRITSLRGVGAASWSDVRPGTGNYPKDDVSLAAGEQTTQPDFNANYGFISPGLFDTVGASMINGRDFSWADDDHAPHVAILNSKLAGMMFPSGDAVGHYIRLGNDPSHANLGVVGVVNDGRLLDVRHPQGPGVYLPALQTPIYGTGGSMIVRVSGNPQIVAAAVRHEIDALGHEYAFKVRTVDDISEQLLLPERITAILSGCFAITALMLSLIGLYGLMSYNVARRTREIGVRIALGAQRGRILRTVLCETLLLTLAGIAIGLPCAFAATRLIASMLYGLSRADATTSALVVSTLLVIGVLAGYLPGRRAMRVDPMVALRHE